MSNGAKKILTAADMGRKGGAAKTKAKRIAARKNLEKARKTRWVDSKRLV